MDFSLTTLFVAPVGQTALPSAGSTQDLTAGQLGFFSPSYALETAATVLNSPYFYVAQGRANTYLQGSKRSDKISGSKMTGGLAENVIDWYKVTGNNTANTQILDVSDFKVSTGEDITLTIRAHSSYIDTLYFNGLTKSVTIKGECIECGSDPCTSADIEDLVDALILKLNEGVDGMNPDNWSLSDYFTFTKVGTGATTILRITGKALTKYGVPCDIAANPHEYDRMFFKVWVTKGPDTTADFEVNDSCDVVATTTVTREASYATGTSEEIAQLEKNFYSYQAGYLKHLYRNMGYNQNFESYVTAGTSYDTYYIKFRDYDAASQNWGDRISLDSTVIIAAQKGSAINTAINAFLVAALGPKSPSNTVS